MAEKPISKSCLSTSIGRRESHGQPSEAASKDSGETLQCPIGELRKCFFRLAVDVVLTSLQGNFRDAQAEIIGRVLGPGMQSQAHAR